MTLLLPLVISCTIFCSCGIPLDDFFPYGVEAGDSSNNKTLDGSSSALTLPFPFRFFNTLYSTLYVNNNGHMSFDEPLNFYTPQPFPIPDLPLIAPYWADVDTRPPDGGQVWYRISTDNSLMTHLIRSVMNSSQLTLSSFTPQYLVIVTWDHVGYYEKRTDKTNTFQCILAADNITSYVIYQYADDEIQWTTGSDSGGIDGLGGEAAVVGYNAGDCIRYKTVRESMTINITKNSNVGIPGVYVFKVDGTERCTVGIHGTITTTYCSMVPSTFSANTHHSMTITSTKTMVTTSISVTSATNTPNTRRPDHCPKVETVLCGDNTVVVTGGIGGVMGLIILIQSVVIIVLFIRRNVKIGAKNSTPGPSPESEGEHKMVVTSNSAYGVVSVREELQYEVIGLRQTRNHH